MRVIFLDVDGVLNCQTTLQNAKRSDVVDPEMVGRLNKIIEATDAKVVLSSTWRLIFGTDKTFNDYLIPAGFVGEVIGETPNLNIRIGGNIPRGREIRAWLKQHPEVDQFIILDDVNNMDGLQDHLILTSFMNEDGGLQDEHVKQAIDTLLSVD